MEYIEREAAMAAACKALCHPGFLCPDFKRAEVRDAFNSIHAADVRPVVRGKWEHIELIDGHSMGECSNCLKVRIVDNFCPNCGADMRE